MTNNGNKQETSATNTPQLTQQRDGQEVRVALITGLITLAGVIITALLAPIALEVVRYKLNATITPIPLATDTSVPIPTDFSTNTPEVLTSPTLTETIPQPPTDAPTANPQAEAEIMTAQLSFSSSAGNVPLMVNFNARNSYLTRPNQPTLTCVEKNVCSYTWSVRLGGTTIYGPSLGESAFSYTFQKEGEYIVVVTVCRGDTCNFATTNILVKSGNEIKHTITPTGNSNLTGTPIPTLESSSLRPNPTQTIQAAFAEVEKQFQDSLISNIAFNKPSQMEIGKTESITLLINPSIPESIITTQLVEEGDLSTLTANSSTLVGPGGGINSIEIDQIEITPLMKAILLSQDPDAFAIEGMHDNPEQIISLTNTTEWRWSVTAKKKGIKTLELIIFRLIKYNGNEYWHEVETYKADINVNVTMEYKVNSLDWKWFISVILIPLLVWIWNRTSKKKNRRKGIQTKKNKKSSQND